MGCAVSKHVGGLEEPIHKHVLVSEYSVTAKHPSATKIARLKVDCTLGAGEVTASVDDGHEAELACPGGPASPTRMHRLSHTYTEEVSDRVPQEAPAEGIDYGMCQCSPAQAVEAGPMVAQAQAKQPSPISVHVACMSKTGCEPGYKKVNQDNCFAFEKYITPDQALFGVMDGHGPNGHFVAGFVRKHLPMLLVQHVLEASRRIGLDGNSSDGRPWSGSSTMGSKTVIQQALGAAFPTMDAGLDSSGIDCEFSGCTCAVMHLQGRTLTTAWVGDSRMVLGRLKHKVWDSSWEAIDLSTDHKPSMPAECKRILNSGGRVERTQTETGKPIGPYRVWLKDVRLPGLAMSRAMGDKVAKMVGVIAEPHILQRELTVDDKVLVLASDGVWEFISSKQAIEIVADCETPEDACKALVHAAYTRWCEEESGTVDDITAVVVFLNHGRDKHTTGYQI